MRNWSSRFTPLSGELIDTFEVGELLAALTDKSLVAFDEATGRYRLLETVRDYMRIMLANLGAADVIRTRHRDYFVTFSEIAEPELAGAQQALHLHRLESEHDNLRAALEWAVDDPAGSDDALRICGASWRFWEMTGQLEVGSRWCLAAINHPAGSRRTKWRAKAINGAGVFAARLSDYQTSRAFFEEGLAIWRELEDLDRIGASLNSLGYVACLQGEYAEAVELIGQSLVIRRERGDQHGIAHSLTNLGIVTHEQGDLLAARALHKESLEIKRKLGDQWDIALSLGNLANVTYDLGEYFEARSLYEESIGIRRELGDQFGIALSLCNLGNLATDKGDYRVARTLYAESLTIRRQLGDRWGAALSLEGLAALAKAETKIDRSARLWGAAERLREQIGGPLPPSDLRDQNSHIDVARSVIGRDHFYSLWQEGRSMTLDEAITYALENDEL